MAAYEVRRPFRRPLRERGVRLAVANSSPSPTTIFGLAYLTEATPYAIKKPVRASPESLPEQRARITLLESRSRKLIAKNRHNMTWSGVVILAAEGSRPVSWRGRAYFMTNAQEDWGDGK